MAQINSRVADEDKEKAEKVLKLHGLSMSGYFASIVEYIADSGAIPFEIKPKPKLINLDEVYAEAVNKFIDLHHRLLALKCSLQPGVEDQLEQSQPHRNDFHLITAYLRENERYVYRAPCQIEKITISDGQVLDFSSSREGFNTAQSSLAEALSCVSFNNYPLRQSDLDEMDAPLAAAKKVLDSLRSRCSHDLNEESKAAFFAIAAKDAIQAARALTEGPYDPLSFPPTFNTVDACCRDALACHKRVGPGKWSTQAARIAEHLVKMRNEIDRWNQERLTHATLQNNYEWLNFKSDIIDLTDELVRALLRSTMRNGSR